MMRITMVARYSLVSHLLLLFITPGNALAVTEAESELAHTKKELLGKLATSYRLQEDQLVARFRPPFPEARDELVELLFKDHPEYVTSCRFLWSKDRLCFLMASESVPIKGMPFVPASGATLDSTIRLVTETPESRIVGRVDLLKIRVAGDFVWRKSAKHEDIAAELAKLLQPEIKPPLQFEYVKTPLDVIVLSNPDDNGELKEKKTSVDIHGLHPRMGKAEEQGDWQHFVTWLEYALNVPVEDETRGQESREIVWNYEPYYWTKEELKPGWTYDAAVEKERANLLQRLSEQLGISIRTERRPMRVLQISVEESNPQ